MALWGKIFPHARHAPVIHTPPGLSSCKTCSGVVGARKHASWYCTPHMKVKGSLSVSSAKVYFKPDMSCEEDCNLEFSAEDYEVTIQAVDLVDVAAIAAPTEDDEHGDEVAHFFLQLHVRTLDGRRFCKPEDTEHSWCVVFQLDGRANLHEVASVLVGAMKSVKIEMDGGYNTGNAAAAIRALEMTSVPYPSLDCAALIEVATRKRVQNAARECCHEKPPVGVQRILFRKPDGCEKTLLTRRLAESIVKFLPISLRVPGQYEWVLRYSPKAHGVSMRTLYQSLSCCAATESSLLLVQDSENHIFGGFTAEQFEPCGRFYGSGEAFVFSFGHVPQLHDGDSADTGRRAGETSPGDGGASSPALDLRVYSWTGSNSYFMYADNNVVAMGGGDGHHAIGICSNLLKGHSSPTTTFGNPTLASSDEFVIRDLEIWTFQDVDELG